MIRMFVVIALVWLAALPPFFTDGACTAEFDQVARQIEDNKAAFATAAGAQAYWSALKVPVQVISAEHCRVSRPRFVDSCAPGDLVYLAVPIQNKVCHYYRDSSVRVQYKYDDRGRLRQFQADMAPFKVFSIPWLGIRWYWGK
jgi:hypothetical protein